jgi:hypothetical protein
MWSTGNEIIERGGRSDGYAYSRRLADFVRSLDNTRAVTNAANGIGSGPAVEAIAANLMSVTKGYDFFARMTEKFFEPLEAAGYNYLHSRYESDSELFSNRVIWGAETFPNQIYDSWNEVEKFYTPLLEKVLVDLFAEEKLFYYLQGSELIHIYENAINKYAINFTKLFSYAKRREREQDIKQFMINHMFHLVKDILDD